MRRILHEYLFGFCALSSAYVAAFIADKILQHAGHKYFRIPQGLVEWAPSRKN